MSLFLPERTRDGVLAVVAALLDLGSGPGVIRLFSEDSRVLAVLKFPKPVAVKIEGGIMTLGSAVDPSAQGSGSAVAASLEDSDGNQVLACDVSDLNGGAVIQLNTTQISAGGPVEIRSFRLTQPGDP